MDDVRVGKNCVIDETAKLVGPLVLGDFNIVEAAAVVSGEIGEGNRFEIGCHVSGRVGNYNVFKTRCRVDGDAVITDGCCIGATVHISKGHIAPNTSVWRYDNDVRVSTCPHLPDLHRIVVEAHHAAAIP